MILDPQLLAKISDCVIIVLLSIIKDDDLRDSEAANDALPNEVLNIFLCDSEVVNPYDEEFELPYNNGEGSNYVQSPLGERPRGVYQCKFLSWLPYDVAKVLAFVIHLYIGLGILLHNGLIVPSSYQLVNQ